MTLRMRRLIYSTFIAIFFLVSPPLVFYTAGYRYDFKHNRVIETGSLVVKSYPPNADIYLDDVLYQEKTPTIVNTISPGTVHLRIEKEGYRVWKKDIEIEPRVTSFEETVRLFADTEPTRLIKDGVVDYWWNNRQEKIVYQTATSVRLLNTLNNSDTLIANINPSIRVDISWSKDNNWFILARTTSRAAQNFIINANQPDQFIDLANVTTLNLSNVQWNPSSSDSVYALSGGALYRIPYLLKETRLIHRGFITDYQVEEKRIVFIEQPLKSTGYLSWISLSDSDTIHRVAEIASPETTKIIPTHSHRVAYQDINSRVLTVIDPTIIENSIDVRERSIANIKEAVWSTNGDYLFYTDGFALYRESFTNPITVIPSKPSSQIITRYSSPIGHLFIGDDESFIYYTVGESLRVIQFGDQHSVRLVDGIAGIQKPAFFPAKQAITYIDENGSLLFLPLLREHDINTGFFGG